MKSTILLLILMSVSAFAKVESYQCFTKEKLPAKITIEFSKCDLTDQKTFDICEADEGKVIIPFNPSDSLLFTATGETVELTCREFDDPSTTIQQQQSERAPIPTATRAEPGHGGSNVRGRQ